MKQQSLSFSSNPPAGVSRDASCHSPQDREYFKELRALVVDACEHQRLPTLVDELAHALATIMIHCGPEAAGDALLRIGGHIRRLADQQRAQTEAQAARKEGQIPH
jgi:hypothetical protein